ncbi:hypothetical protein A1O3_06153 [Capronia epimyces CBS 606.96]|uniref:Aminoglycoside phosphotransferase domain-containing protein n=1 Tax=Capronia epimyces CBS 606.96 TaxID=1182542 RepID=W9XYC6_9EURO|nr:uncharacterized protein A1O3_06153 [Capronia epimyces CBS 606.96]EXJ82340.1 hypothetical protein A1O3_06153 [Capronia epimyces CBS 606.96]
MAPLLVLEHNSAPALALNNKSKEWEEIEEEDDNMLIKLQWEPSRQAFLDDLQRQIPNIRRLIAHHLSLSRSQQCEISDRSEWRGGGFNACIPVNISNWRRQRLMLRCPFPYMQAGPDGLDEKIRCEAATYIWISQNCPRVPIPRLWGFGLPNGSSFRSVRHLSWIRRVIEALKRCWAWRQPFSAPFARFQTPFPLKSGYLLVDFVEQGQGIKKLSEIWPPATHVQRQNFYRSLSRIMLDLARHHFTKIGSFTVDNYGNISLSNRPLTIQLPLLESSGIPTGIPRDRTYVTTDSYIRDILKCHDMKLRYQPNAVPDESEAQSQMPVLTIMRALSPSFTMEPFQSGPFCHIWTDCDPSNILVNQRYDITCLFDLEWIPVLPIERLSPPFWLSGYPVDGLGEEKRIHYDAMCVEFLDIFGQEDNNQHSPLKPRFYTKIMKNALEKATPWFWASLDHPRVTYNLFLDHLQPRLAPTHSEGVDCIQFHRILAPYWTLNASGFVDEKIKDHQKYLEDLRTRHLARFVGSG